MVAETSINDVLLVVAGGAMGILGSFLTFLVGRSQRSVERAMDAYSEYVPATEHFVLALVASESVNQAVRTAGRSTEKTLDLQTKLISECQEAKSR